MVSSAEVAEALRGIDFPATKTQCIDYAKSRKAPRKVLDVMKKMPEKPYENMVDVFNSVGQLEMVL